MAKSSKSQKSGGAFGRVPRPLAYAVFTIVGLFALYQLWFFGSGRYTSIGTIVANPDKYLGKAVMVKGVVREPSKVRTIFNIGFYWVADPNDANARLYVQTPHEVPPEGQGVSIQGTVGRMVPLKGVQKEVLCLNDLKMIKTEKLPGAGSGGQTGAGG